MTASILKQDPRLINSAAGNQLEWMKDYNHIWLSLGYSLFWTYVALTMLLIFFLPFPLTPSDAFTVAYHSTYCISTYIYIHTCMIVWECIFVCVSLSPLSFVVVFLSFDGSETLIKINVIWFASG